MAVTPKRFAKGLGSTVLTTVYTVPANTTAILKAITLCNVSSNPSSSGVDFSLTIGGTKIINSHVIKGFDTITIPFLDQILLAGETIQIQSASGGAVSYIISGKEVT